jgi:uncharacterized membrane protein (DUF4010 family)
MGISDLKKGERRNIVNRTTPRCFELSLLMDSNGSLAIFPQMLIALAIGLLIGGEREWSQRSRHAERVTAGIRTFGLLGLLGCLAVVLSVRFHPYIGAIVLVGVVLLVVAGYIVETRASGDWGMTTEIAMLVTFALGALVALNEVVLAAGLGVLVAALLSLKSVLHSRVHRLTPAEVSGALKLLFISVVMLPLLPNQAMGPFDIFNPYVVWWMVVLIAALGFVAYVAMRATDSRQGILLTALLGGIVSSTAMTLTLARMAKSVDRPNVLVAGLLMTSALMFPRVLLEVGLLAPRLLDELMLPLGLAMVIYLAGAGVFMWREIHDPDINKSEVAVAVKNPFELLPALKFTALLVFIMVAVELAQRFAGDAGVYVTAAISGAADVDAITLSLAGLAQSELSHTVAADGIIIAAASNSLAKLVLAGLIGGKAIAWRTGPCVLLAVAVALSGIFLR